MMIKKRQIVGSIFLITISILVLAFSYKPTRLQICYKTDFCYYTCDNPEERKPHAMFTCAEAESTRRANFYYRIKKFVGVEKEKGSCEEGLGKVSFTSEGPIDCAKENPQQ